MTQAKLTTSSIEKIVDKIVDLSQYMGEVKFYPYQLPFARRLTQSIVLNEGATLTALFSRQCIAEDSLIMDRSGNVLPIQKYPNAWKTQDKAHLIEVTIYGGHKIRCTEEHPIATPEGYVSAMCLKPNDRVIILDKWDKFGDGIVPLDGGGKLIMTDSLAQLVGWFTAYVDRSEEVKIKIGKDKVNEVLEFYFPDCKKKVTKNQIVVTISGKLKAFLKAMKYNSDGFPENVNYFTKTQLIHFFYPLFLLHGKSYKKTNTVKTVLKGRNERYLNFCKEHLNKLGLHGAYAIWVGECLIFQAYRNYIRFKVIFGHLLPKEYFPPLFICRNLPDKTFEGQDGERLVAARVHSIKRLEVEAPVWDAEFEDKGWFLVSGTQVHNSGKTQAVAMVTAACMVLPTLAEKFPEQFGMFIKGFWAGCFGPIGEQAVTMFDRIHSVFTTDNSKRLFIEELKMPIPAQGGARGNLIRLRNKSFVRYQSGGKRAKVESKTYHLIILDECQDMEAFKIRKSIIPSGAAVNATIVATGTPDIYIGYFYDTIEQNKIFDINSAKLATHFEVDYQTVQRYNPMYKKFIQKEAKRIGIDSDEFKMAYRLIWPVTKGMVFTKTQLDEKCYDKQLKTVREYKETPCIAGLDLGKSQDSTVVTVLKVDWGEADEEGNVPKTILGWLELEGDNWEDQYDKVVDFLSNYWVDTLVCDSSGVGDPVREHYAVLLPKINVVPFVFSPTSKDIGYKYFIGEVNAKRLTIPAHPNVRETKRFKKFEQQMTTIKKHYSGKFLSPKPVDEEKGHDDFPDSLMLAVFGTYYDIMPEIEIDDNDIYKTYRNHNELYGKTYSDIIRRR
jgi:hypothetical protein